MTQVLMLPPTLNPRTFEAGVAETDGAGAISTERTTGGITSIAFATDGSNGIIVVDLVDQEDEDYVALGSFNGGVAGATLQPTQAANQCLFTALTPAGVAVDLSTTAAQLSILIVPTGAMTASS